MEQKNLAKSVNIKVLEDWPDLQMGLDDTPDSSLEETDVCWDTEPVPELPDGMEVPHDLNLERGIYQQEESGVALSGILLGALAIPVAVFFLYSLIPH